MYPAPTTQRAFRCNKPTSRRSFLFHAVRVIFRALCCSGFAAGTVAHSAAPAYASLPVPFVMIGCISNSRFVTVGEAATPPLTHSAIKALEGKTIRVHGFLYPPSYPTSFEAESVYELEQRCVPVLFGGYFLCDPCQTQFDHPQSVTVPPREPGKRLEMPASAIKEFNNLGQRLRGKPTETP